MKIIEFKKQVAQGDIVIRKVGAVGKGFEPVKEPMPGSIVVAHSETGHHHLIQADGVVRYEDPKNPLICYLRLASVGQADIVHHRPWDIHDTIRLSGLGSTFEIRRQREYVPNGWIKAQD